ncbi:MAG: leucine-rich repeat protein [bacterium]
MLKNILLFLLFLSFQNVFAVEFVDGEYGARWDSGVFSEAAEINRLLPIMTIMRAVSLINVTKSFVRRDDFLFNFDNLSESEFKNELRRQYYLYKKILIDKIPISFSIQELLDSDFFSDVISRANKDGNLNLSNFKISDLDGLQNLMGLVSISVSSLDLSNNDISVIAFSNLAFYSSRLGRLILSNNSISDLQLGCFDSLINLEFIDLGQNYITNLPDFIFSKCMKLRKIDLSDNSIRRINKDSFFGLQNCLEKINLLDNPLVNLQKDFFQEFEKLKNILWG